MLFSLAAVLSSWPFPTSRSMSRALQSSPLLTSTKNGTSCNEVPDFDDMVAREKAINQKRQVTLSFADDISQRTWNIENSMSGGGNWEFQWYNPSKTLLYTENNSLVIHPRMNDMIDPTKGLNLIANYPNPVNGLPLPECTDPAFSGCNRGPPNGYASPMISSKITTKDNFAFKYGVLEVEFTLPQGNWFWPAFWMLPEQSRYGSWPAEGEIDLIESYGNAPSNDTHGQDYTNIGTTLHYGMPTLIPTGPSRPPSQDAWRESHCTFNNPAGFAEPGTRHKLTLLWTPEMIAVKIDNTSKMIMNVSEMSPWERVKKQFPEVNENHNPWAKSPVNAPFDQFYYLIVNVAVGCGLPSCYFTNLWKQPWMQGCLKAQNCFYDYIQKNPYNATTGFVLGDINVWPRDSYGGTSATTECTPDNFASCVKKCVHGAC